MYMEYEHNSFDTEVYEYSPLNINDFRKMCQKLFGEFVKRESDISKIYECILDRRKDPAIKYFILEKIDQNKYRLSLNDFTDIILKNVDSVFIDSHTSLWIDIDRKDLRIERWGGEIYKLILDIEKKTEKRILKIEIR